MKSLWLILSFVSLLYPQIWSPPIEVDPPGLSPTSVVPVIDKFGRIVCFYRDWMFYLDTLTEKWSEPEEIPERIWLLAGRLKDGDLWITTMKRHFFYYHYNRWSEPIPPASKENMGYAVGDSANRLWMSWREKDKIMVGYYDGERWSEPYYMGGGTDPSFITVDCSGRIWVSWFLRYYLFIRYFERGGWSDLLFAKDGIRQPNFAWDWLAPDASGNIWLATVNTSSDSASVLTFYYDMNEWKAIDSIYAGRFPDMWWSWHPRPELCVDYSGIVWLVWESTIRDTLGEAYFSYYDGERWSEPAPIYPSFHLNHPKSLVVDNKNRVWVFLVSSQDGRVYTSHTKGKGIEEHKRAKRDSGLFRISPNPFKEVTSIKYQVTSRGKVNLLIYDAQGRLVRALERENQKPGIYMIKWDGRDERGRKVVSGVYFLRLKTKGFAETRKVTLIR